MIKRFLTVLALLLLTTSAAQAQLAGNDAVAGDSCSSLPTGATALTANAAQDGTQVVLICDGSVWQSATGSGGTDTLAGLSCSSGQIAKWNGSTWTCAADDTGMSALPDLSFASIWVGNASDEAAAVGMSGDAALSSTGVLTIAANAITSAKIDDGAITTADIADEAVTAAKTDFVGTLTEGKWCTVSSGKIVCTSDAPSGGSGGANFQTFTATGTSTWNKPATGTIAFVECWGAGGSGARYSTAGAGKGGGGGGGYSSSWLPLSALPASVTVTVGVGGAARSSNGNGSAGGNSAFGSFVIGYGGGGGEGGSTAKGGGGGGQMSAGSIGTPGRPFMLVGYNPNTEDTTYAGSGGWSKTVMASGYPYPAGDGTNHGGGGGGGTLAATVAGGDSVYGGGGGGGRVSSTNGAAGMSLFAGAGGAGGAPASDGQQPGGGGGGSSTTSGKGGDGQCNVTVF